MDGYESEKHGHDQSAAVVVSENPDGNNRTQGFGQQTRVETSEKDSHGLTQPGEIENQDSPGRHETDKHACISHNLAHTGAHFSHRPVSEELSPDRSSTESGVSSEPYRPNLSPDLSRMDPSHDLSSSGNSRNPNSSDLRSETSRTGLAQGTEVSKPDVEVRQVKDVTELGGKSQADVSFLTQDSKQQVARSSQSHVHQRYDPCRAERASDRSWRDSAQGMDQGTDHSSIGGVGRRRNHAEGQTGESPPQLGDSHQPSSAPQARLAATAAPRDATGDQPQLDHRHAEAEGFGKGRSDHPRTPEGLCGLWNAQPSDLPGSPGAGISVLPVGCHDYEGRRMLPTSTTPGRMVGDSAQCGRGQIQEGQGNQQQEDGEGSQLSGRSTRNGSYPQPDTGGAELGWRGGEGQDGEQGSQAPYPLLRGRDFWEQRVGEGEPDGQPTAAVIFDGGDQDEMDDTETRVGELSLSQARTLDWQASRLMPECMETLVQFGRPILYEIACAPDSVLSGKMQKLCQRSDAAKRLAFWNGYDVSSSQGVRAIIKEIDQGRPEHVWLSLECGPFSPMQRVNQRNEKQIQELKLKREACMKSYVGGLIIYIHCVQQGIPVTWEWSEHCDAWRLPMVQNVFQKYPPRFVVAKGCRVGLKDPKSQKLLGKGWKMATTHDGVAEAMELPCRCHDKHALCQGSLTRMTAYYTDEFAKRVCRALMYHADQTGLYHELLGKTSAPQGYQTQTVSCSCEQVQHPKSVLQCNVCEKGKEAVEKVSLLGDEMEGVEQGPLTEQEKELCLQKIAILHRNTGHGPLEHLVKALEVRRTDPRVIELAKTFECSTCKELSRQVPRSRVSLEPVPPKWSVVQTDNAHWRHPHTKVQTQFTLMIDEGCRFRIGKIMVTGNGGINGTQMTEFYRDQWKPIFGKPRKLRVDPAGPWRSDAVAEYLGNEHVELETIPAEAHWGISHVERAIQCTKQIMTKLAIEDPDISPEEALAEAIRTENEREVVRGFSPTQHALGRVPDEHGRLGDNLLSNQPEVLCENPNGEFQRNCERMKVAEKAHTEFIYNDRLKRAQNTRSYRVRNFAPGDLVYVWRIQGKTKGPASTTRSGGFTGPCRILATETKLTDEGNYRPGSVVWLIRGSRLIKASHTQLRHASAKEEYVEALSNPPDLPWTFTKLAQEIGDRQYDDLVEDEPAPMELEQAMDEEQSRPVLRRVRQKRYVPECPAPSREARGSEEADEFGHVVESLGDHFQDHYAECFWSTDTAAVEIEVPIPETKRGKAYMFGSFESYLTTHLRRRAVEVSERTLDDEELAQMKDAKNEEVKKFLGAEALKVLPPHLQPNKSVAMRMRWILTWKREETGDRKAKARCVILGYQDPHYENRQTMAPTMSRTSRQLLLVIAAAMKMRVAKGDVSGAFLQGRSYRHEAYVIPTDEICDAMGISSGSITQLRKACYGLVDAPLEWFLTVSDFLVSIGFQRCVCDPCCFKYVDGNGRLIGLISGHVDDFLFCGQTGCKIWEDLCSQIQRKFKWGQWEYDKFVQCGVKIESIESGGFDLSQAQYVDDIKEISISSERRRELKAETTDNEKTKLRATLGALSWCAQQTSPHLSAGVSLLLSQVTTSKVETLIEVNKLVYRTKCNRKHVLKIHGGLQLSDLLVAGWSDAAAQNRNDGKSTLGIFVGITSQRLTKGEMCNVSPVFWRSAKIGRQCRSPGAAEALAAIECEDAMYGVRLQLLEMLGESVKVRKTEEQVAKVPAVLITDSTNVYDRMQSEVYVPKGPEYRTSLELIGLKEASVRTDMPIRWVHSDAQLANSLTKDSEQQQLQRYYHLGQAWKIVDDPLMRSARNRKKLGLDALDLTDNASGEPETMKAVQPGSGGC